MGWKEAHGLIDTITRTKENVKIIVCHFIHGVYHIMNHMILFLRFEVLLPSQELWYFSEQANQYFIKCTYIQLKLTTEGLE